MEIKREMEIEREKKKKREREREREGTLTFERSDLEKIHKKFDNSKMHS